MEEPNPQPPGPAEETNNKPPGLTTLTGRFLRTGLGALRNRGELLAIEWQEEKARMTELLVWTVGLVFLGVMTVGLLTLTIILLFPAQLRIYAAAGFTLLYLGAAVAVWFNVKSLLKREPFADSLEQARKDAEWLESLK